VLNKLSDEGVIHLRLLTEAAFVGVWRASHPPASVVARRLCHWQDIKTEPLHSASAAAGPMNGPSATFGLWPLRSRW
jgi:hypothetical protein